MKKFENGEITLVNGTKLVIETKSLVGRPDVPNTPLCFSYPTMVKLAHNGENNGKLIAAHATLFGTRDDNGYKIYESNDDGDTWNRISNAIDDFTPGVYDNILQPCLFELPKEMGGFKEGTLFLGGCSRGKFPDGSGMSAVTLYYSEDVGLTWKAYHVLAMGGTAQAKEGVWEPFFYYDDETGRVFCFYSDETDPKYNQVLGFKYTTDMKNWSEIKYAVANEQPELRPGMIAISKMNNGEYLMTFEMVGLKGNPIYYKKTRKIDDWGDLADYGKLIITDDGKSLGSAPWNAWTPVGGEKGIVFMGANHKVTGESIFGTGTDLFLSFDYGETWTAIENPIPFAPTKCGKTSYSPYIGFSEDGRTMYYLSGSDYGECNQMMFARIRIID